MELTIFAVAALTGIAAVLIIGGQTNGLDTSASAPLPSRPTSPLDEAERILAQRYAKGEITPDEYSRMLSILRR